MVLSQDGSIHGTVKSLEKQKLQNLKKHDGKRSRKGEGRLCSISFLLRLVVCLQFSLCG